MPPPPFPYSIAHSLSLSGSMILVLLRAKELEVLATSVSALPIHQLSPVGLLTVLRPHSFAECQEAVESPLHRLTRIEPDHQTH